MGFEQHQPRHGDSSTAATNIQDAVDAANSGDTVVTNGVYHVHVQHTGNLIVTNRVVITNLLTLKSVNGPSVTSIRGQPGAPGTINDYGAVRCVDLVDGATLSGFTITNGATLGNRAAATPSGETSGVALPIARPAKAS